MSVLIKGMELPKDCEDCRFCIGLADTEYGTCAGCLIDGEYREASSKSGCPLVEISEPHGDLIDRSMLDPDSEYEDGDFWAVSVAQIELMPPVIEAEGSENE